PPGETPGAGAGATGPPSCCALLQPSPCWCSPKLSCASREFAQNTSTTPVGSATASGRPPSLPIQPSAQGCAPPRFPPRLVPAAGDYAGGVARPCHRCPSEPW